MRLVMLKGLGTSLAASSQGYALFPHLTLYESVAYGFRMLEGT